MKTLMNSTMALLSLFTALALANTATAGAMCMSTCNDRHLTCGASGKSDEACLSAWHQCKVACSAAPKLAPSRTSATAMSTAHVVKATAPR